jgi:hydroxymethylpyrimidine/phosphomethylpyrimidine kinase
MKQKPMIISIAGSDPSSGAGIQADLRAFEATGVYGCTVITAITIQTATEVKGWVPIDPDLVKDQLFTLLDNYPIPWVKCGMLPTAEIMNIIKEAKEKYHFQLIVDPILISSSGTPLMPEAVREHFKTIILPITDVLTPNANEAEILTGEKITTMPSILSVGAKFDKLGVKTVVIKGGHIDEKSNQIVDYIYEEGQVELFTRTRVQEQLPIHGTGCIFSATLAAQLLLTPSVYEALQNTEHQLEHLFRDLLYIPSGKDQTQPTAAVLDPGVDAQHREVMEQVVEVYNFIKERRDYTALIPEVRTNIAICLDQAKTLQDVAAIEGRITIVNGFPIAAGPVKFGAANHTGRLILAAHQKDPIIHACINIKFDPQLIPLLAEQGLRAFEIQREKQPQTVRNSEKSTMHWVIEQIWEQYHMIPDIIWDCGEPEKEPMIRLFAESGKYLIEKIKLIMRVAKEIGIIK